MTSTNTKTSAEIAREVDSKREGIDATLEALGERLQPKKLAGEAWDFAAGSGGRDLVRNLGSSVRDNPLPLLLLGTGIAWLISGKSGRLPRFSQDDSDQLEPGEDIYDYRRYQGTRRRYTAATRYQSDRDDPAYSRPYTEADAAGLSGQGTDEPSLSERVREGAGRAGDRISDTAARAGEAFEQGASYVGDRASDLRRRASRLEGDVSRSARRLGKQARHSFEDNPLVFAVAGLAVGALFGAIVKTTNAEREYLGETSNRVKDRARDFVARGAEQAMDAVVRTGGAIMDEAEEQGLTTAGAQDAARNFGDRVRKVVERGTEHIAEEADALGGRGESK